MSVFRIMDVLAWAASECDKVQAGHRTREECFRLVGEIKSKGGDERDAAKSVQLYLARFAPPQEEIPLDSKEQTQ